MKLVINESGSGIEKAFRQYSKLLSAIEGCLLRKGNKFMWSSKYGFLTSSPHDIGTGLEVQVKARLPKLIKVKTMSNKESRSQGANGTGSVVNSPGFCLLTQSTLEIETGFATIKRRKRKKRTVVRIVFYELTSDAKLKS